MQQISSLKAVWNRDSHCAMRVDMNTIEGCNHTTKLHGVLCKADLVECLGKIRDYDVLPASNLEKGGVHVWH